MKTTIKTTKQGIRVFIPCDLSNFDAAVRRAAKKVGQPLRHLSISGDMSIFAPEGDASFAIKYRRDQRRFANLRGPAPFMRKIQSRAAKIVARWAEEEKLIGAMGWHRSGWIAALCAARRVPPVALSYAFGVGKLNYNY